MTLAGPPGSPVWFSACGEGTATSAWAGDDTEGDRDCGVGMRVWLAQFWAVLVFG